MRWGRLGVQLVLGILVGIGLAFGIHALIGPSSPQVTVTQTPASPAPAVVEQRPKELPPETKEVLAQFGNNIENPPRGDVRLMVISDLNDAYGATTYAPEVTRAIKLIPFWQPDMIVCSGDMVAGQFPALTEAQMRAMWEAFDRTVAAPIRQLKIPYGFTIGNHDASSALSVNKTFLFQKERDVAAEYWRDPKHDPGVNFVDKFEFPFYFTFEFKDIFFLVWDGSSHHIPPDKLAWVEKSLASPRAQQAKMRILLGHLPLYAVAIGRNDPGEVMENADKLRAMLEKYNVHTYISGHHHAYYPAHKGKLQLLHMGILGAGPRPLLAGNTSPCKTLTILDIRFDSPE
ncbi:MAG: metallophosphoesterase, partial [Gloeomargarita sp. SKYG116]|nr:metallophosphoesterase [Gloeomargarita sp. SKYG116]MDW8402279.1 metallophosphoesterase [Gloeomargarita sp. SKYGB_i_bin116]